jgi:ribonuclease HII
MDALSAALQNAQSPEKVLYDRGYTHIAGVDEAGRGPLAGPVVASAVMLPPGWKHPGIKDSKQLTAQKRETLFPVITQQAKAWSWALIDHREIDTINIHHASLKAMQCAVESLAVMPDYLLIDGRFPIATALPQTPITRGDQKSIATSAASIIAKVIRDAIMGFYHDLYPQYNFARNKGYGTAEHLAALCAYGRCPIHRKTFTRGIEAREHSS